MDYLLRLSEPDPPDESSLQLFSDEEEFAAYLVHLIEMNHYSGAGPLISGIWGWDSDDTREELYLANVDEKREDDWLDWYYQVRRKAMPQVPLVSFTVRIDGRS